MFAGLIVGAALCAGADPAPTAEARKDALAHYGAAVWNLRRERLLSAVKQFETAAKQDPAATAPKRELVRLYAQLARDPEAIRLGRKVLEADPDDHETALLLARLLFDAGEPAEAVAAAKRATASRALPGRADRAVRAYRELAALCERAGDPGAAEEALRAAVELLTEKRADAIAQRAFTPKEADTEAAECLERLGRVLVARRKFDEAAAAFERAAGLHPEPAAAARVSWNLSGALEAKGEPAAALERLEAFLELKPRAAEPFVRYAKLLRDTGTVGDEAVRKLRAHAARDPDNKALAAVVAWEQTRTEGHRAAGDEALAKLIETADPELVALFVRAHLDTGRPSEIIKELDRSFAALDDARKEKPQLPGFDAAKRRAAEKARAVADALAGNPDGAAALLRAAGDDLRAGAKRGSGTAFFLGALAQRHGKLPLAELQFRQALRAAPPATLGETYQALFNVLWLAGKPAEVEALCRDAIGNPDVPLSETFFNFHHALALAELGRADAALRAADKAVLQAGDTDRLTVRLRKHTVLRVLGKWDEAVDYGAKLLDEFPDPADRARVRYAQATALWGANRRAAAEALLRALLDDDPDHAAACNDLGYHLADEGRNLNEAERLIRHALAVDRLERRRAGSAEPESASYLDSLGWVLFRQGRLKEARATLERAARLAQAPVDGTIWDHLGDVLFRLGDKAQARAAWEGAKALYEADERPATRAKRDGRLEELKRKLERVPPADR